MSLQLSQGQNIKTNYIQTSTNTSFSDHEIHCSHSSGFYTQSFQLELSVDQEDVEIRYTRDGSTPTLDSPLYTTPLSIEDVSNEAYSISGIPTTPLEGPYQLYEMIWKEPENVYKCNIIRYAAFKNGILESGIYSKTFFVDPEIHNRYSFPIASIIVDSLSLFDYDTGIYIPGKRFDENGFNWFAEGNYHNRGREWERKMHLCYFDHNGNIAFETDAGMRMRGYGSTSFPQKSINIYLRSEYGLKNTSYPLFNNPQTEKYKRFIFRTGGNDFLYARIRDAMLHEVMSTMDLEIMDFQPMILFINGEYWGIHNLREKYDEYYFKYKYDIDEEDINILGICGGIEEGDNTDYLDILSLVWNNEIISDENYHYLSDRIDINNFIDFQIAEIFFANYDWPCNNYKIWKDNSPNSKWRFLIYDLDYSFGFNSNLCSYTAPFMEHATSEENTWPFCGCSNILFRRLLTNSDFKEQFLSRFAYHLNKTFTKERLIEIIDDFENLFASEMEEHIQRWHYPDTYEQWEDELTILREFAENRSSYVVQDLVTFFNLTEFDIAYIDSVDDIVLYPNPNNGFFALYNNSYEDIIAGKITIFNSSGQIILTQNNISVNKSQPRYLNFPDLPKGAYILFLESNDIVIKKKMMII